MAQNELSGNARASPTGDARWPRPTNVRNEQGLLTKGRGRLKKQVQYKPLRIASWNIGTLTGRSRELADILKSRRIDLACLQETRWKGQKSRDIGEGYKLIYNGTTNSQGVAIAVNEKLRHQISGVHRYSDRLMSVVIDTPTRRIHIFSAYAPQTGCDDPTKDTFWNELQDAVSTCSEEDLFLLCGDLNGHVGSHSEGYRCHGNFGYDIRNEDGHRILEFAEANDLVITNTFFKKRSSHLITYSSGGHNTQIDYILLRKHDFPIVADTKVIPSECLAPQHKLLITDLRIKVYIRKPYVKGQAKIKWWKLQDHKMTLREKTVFPPVDCDNIDHTWSSFTTSITSIAQSELGVTKPGTRKIDKQTWLWTDNVQEKVHAKKAAFKQLQASKTEETLQNYRATKKEAKKAVAEAKANHHQHLYDQLTTKEGDKIIYRLARSRCRAGQDIEHYMCVKDKNGRRLHDGKLILHRWKEHFSEVFNTEFPHPPIPEINVTAGPVPCITVDEVKAAIRSMKNGKAPGPDDLPAEIWKLEELTNKAITWLTEFFNSIIHCGHIPTDWSTSITIPIFKGKGDPAECTNYRPIRLLSHTMKIFERVLDNRLRNIVQLSINQCGFVKGCGTIDAIFAVRQLMEKFREKRRPLHLAFLDLEKAFDRVPHQMIWYALRDHQVPEIYINWVKMLYNNTRSQVRCPAGLTDSFPVTVGVHQGSALSPLLFIIVMDSITRDLQKSVPWTLLYADDVLLAAETRNDLEAQVQTWYERLQRFGLRLNIHKSEYLETIPSDGSIEINGAPLPKVDTFRYLGSRLQSNGYVNEDVQARIRATWMRFRDVTGVLCDKKMPIRLKSKIYRTMVRPVALYGTECWPAPRSAEHSLHVMEMRILRRSLDISMLDHIHNTTIRQLAGVTPINEKMQEWRLRWYGHIVRASPNSVIGSTYHLNVDGPRQRGRPKLRWLDTINADLRSRHLNQQQALDRNKWRKLIQKADPVPGNR